jgi:hypothetical protein
MPDFYTILYSGTLGRGSFVGMEQNGNHDSGYAASNLEEGPHPVLQEPSASPASPIKHHSLSPSPLVVRLLKLLHHFLFSKKKDQGSALVSQSVIHLFFSPEQKRLLIL